MSARNAKKRAKFNLPDVQAPAPAAGETITVDEWVPDYGRKCESCGKTPCVTGVTDGKVVYEGSLCGVCTWGAATFRDPANW